MALREQDGPWRNPGEQAERGSWYVQSWNLGKLEAGIRLGGGADYDIDSDSTGTDSPSGSQPSTYVRRYVRTFDPWFSSILKHHNLVHDQ